MREKQIKCIFPNLTFSLKKRLLFSRLEKMNKFESDFLERVRKNLVNTIDTLLLIFVKKRITTNCTLCSNLCNCYLRLNKKDPLIKYFCDKKQYQDQLRKAKKQQGCNLAFFETVF